MSKLKVFDLGKIEIAGDWFKAGRLMEKRDKGDKKAKEELERMDDTEMVSIDEIKE